MINKLLQPTKLGTLFNVPIMFGVTAKLMSLMWIYTSYIAFNKNDWSTLTKFFVALAVPVIIYGSVVAHEFAHILTARKYNIDTRRIDLFLFGGAAIMAGEGKTPKESFWIAFAGPALSLFISCICMFLIIPINLLKITSLMELFNIIIFFNTLLFVFNMLFVVYPFDGGRVLNALIWHFTQDKRKSLQISHKISECILYLLGAIAVLTLFVKVPWFGYGISGFMNAALLLFLGYMMMLAAKRGEMPHV